MHHPRSVILALRQYPQGGEQPGTTDRHCGLDPQSRGGATQGGRHACVPHRHTGFKAVSTGGDNKTKPTDRIPLSLDGRGIKGEGENDASASSRHCGLDPQSRGAGRAGQQQDNATNPGPSFPRRRESTARGNNKTTQTIYPPLP